MVGSIHAAWEEESGGASPSSGADPILDVLLGVPGWGGDQYVA